MITRLELTNWRNYEHADLVLGPGTTFVVASNGVGKTSLVEARDGRCSPEFRMRVR